jgi:hypothetical protein
VPVSLVVLGGEGQMLVTCEQAATPRTRGSPPTRPGLDDESGRGLLLVEALAEHWGWDIPPSGRGKIVWALVES